MPSPKNNSQAPSLGPANQPATDDTITTRGLTASVLLTARYLRKEGKKARVTLKTPKTLTSNERMS